MDISRLEALREVIEKIPTAYGSTLPTLWVQFLRALRSQARDEYEGPCAADGCDSMTLSLLDEYGEATWDAYREFGWEQFSKTVRHELVYAWQYWRFDEADHGETFARWTDRLDISQHCERFTSSNWQIAGRTWLDVTVSEIEQ